VKDRFKFCPNARFNDKEKDVGVSSAEMNEIYLYCMCSSKLNVLQWNFERLNILYNLSFRNL